jgi:hypothetical protein
MSSSRFVTPPLIPSDILAHWVQDVDNYIMENLGEFSALNLQIIILSANYYHANSNLGKAWMMHSLSARLAYCLQINTDSNHESFRESECQRRMMWSIWILDRIFAGPVDEFSLCSRFMDDLRVPCDEHFYLAELPVETGLIGEFRGDKPIPHIGCFASLIGLFDIWRDVLL